MWSIVKGVGVGLFLLWGWYQALRDKHGPDFDEDDPTIKRAREELNNIALELYGKPFDELDSGLRDIVEQTWYSRQ